MLPTNVDQTISTKSKQPAEIKSFDDTGQTSADAEKSPPPNDVPKDSLDDDKDEKYLNAGGERIPALTYLKKIRAQSKSSADGTIVLEDPSSLLLTKHFSDYGIWSPLSSIELDQRLMLIKDHPLFKAAAKLDPEKVVFQVISGGGRWKDYLRLDPLTGIVYRSCTISIRKTPDGQPAETLQEAKFVVALTTKIEENGDGSVNVWVKLSSAEPFIPFQQRIRIGTENVAKKVSELKGKNVPNIQGQIFVQPFQPGHYLVPVLARHDLPETSPDNFNIYISIEEQAYANHNYIADKEDNDDLNSLSQSTICVWIINGGPGAKASQMRSEAHLIHMALFRNPSRMVKIRAILVEQRGIGRSHRLSPSRRLQRQNEKDPWSTAMIDLPIDQYGSTAAASDLISIVKAYETMHKDEKFVHLAYGVSYGTRLISNAIRMAPNLFHTVFLASMDGPEVKESNIDNFGPVVVMKNDPLYAGHNEDLSSRLLKAFEGLKDDLRLNPCKVFLKQHKLFAGQPSLLEGFLELANSSKRLDLILFLLLQVHECKNVAALADIEGSEKWTKLMDLMEEYLVSTTFDEAVRNDLYNYSGSNVSGALLLQLVDWIERFQMNPLEYYQKYCEGMKNPAERFINNFSCRDAFAFSESYQLLAKQHPQLADQILHAKQFPVPEADMDAINKSLPRTHVIVIHGALDKTTELGPARKAASDLARKLFKVDMIIDPYAGHEGFMDTVKWCLWGFYYIIDFGKEYEKIINDGLHNEWISTKKYSRFWILKVLENFLNTDKTKTGHADY